MADPKDPTDPKQENLDEVFPTSDREGRTAEPSEKMIKSIYKKIVTPEKDVDDDPRSKTRGLLGFSKEFDQNHPSLQRGTLEDVPEVGHGNSLRKLVGFETSDVIDFVRSTLDYNIAMVALERSSTFENPFKKAEEEQNDNAINEKALRADYLPETRRHVEVGIRTLAHAVRAAQSDEYRDKLLQRKIAYQLALDDFENRQARNLLKAYSDRLDFDSIPKSKKIGDTFGEHGAGVFSYPDMSKILPEFHKDIKPKDPDAEYDPSGGKGKGEPGAA